MKGFTILEVVITITVAGVLLISLLAIFPNFWARTLREDLKVQLTIESQNILRNVNEELKLGAGVRANNTISDPNKAGGWTTSSTDTVLITTLPATDIDGDFIINSSTGAPYLNERVYFSEGSTLYKRTLANTSATGNTAKTTCPEAAATPSCPPDRELSNQYDSFTFTFYDQDDILTSDPLMARSIRSTIVLSNKIFGQTVTATNNIRATLRNNYQ